MGNCYEKPGSLKNDRNKFKIEFEELLKDDDLTESEPNSSFERQTLLDLITEERIQKLMKDFDDLEKGFEKSAKTEFSNKILQTLKTPFELYFKKEATKDYQHILSTLNRLEMPLLPASLIFYEMNMAREGVSQLNTKFQEIELVQTELGPDRNTVVQIVKVAINEDNVLGQKPCLISSVFRRDDAGNFWILGESVLRSQIKKKRAVNELRRRLKSESNIILKGMRVGPVNGDEGQIMLNRGIFRTSVSKLILKPYLAKEYESNMENAIKKMIGFFTREQDTSQLVWFTDDEDEKRKLFLDQRKAFFEMMEQDPGLFDEETKEELENVAGRNKVKSETDSETCKEIQSDAYFNQDDFGNLFEKTDEETHKVEKEVRKEDNQEGEDESEEGGDRKKEQKMKESS